MMQDEVLDWVIRTRDPDFSGWDDFLLWLERDPAHAAAYDSMMCADDALAAIIPPQPANLTHPANDVGDRPRRPLRWIGAGAMAAVMIGAITLGVINRTDVYSIHTRPGETRAIALDDGTRIEINGDTHLRLDRRNPRFAALDGGEAAFTVHHDDARPFRVTVGDTLFEDAGTMFNIIRRDRGARIEVSEGKVIYNPDAEAIALTAGHALATDATGVRLMSVAPDAVASWRQGRLTYDNAAIGDIAPDIARSLGVTIGVTPGVRALRFTGTIRLDHDPARFFDAAAPLMGLAAERHGKGWLLKEEDGPRR